MTWTYTPSESSMSDKDKVRFYIGDTNTKEQLLTDEEILFSLNVDGDVIIKASATCLNALATKFSRIGSVRVGEKSVSGANIAKAFKDRADELLADTLYGGFAAPVFGSTPEGVFSMDMDGTTAWDGWATFDDE